MADVVVTGPPVDVLCADPQHASRVGQPGFQDVVARRYPLVGVVGVPTPMLCAACDRVRQAQRRQADVDQAAADAIEDAQVRARLGSLTAQELAALARAILRRRDP